jgi:hypothetical protein
MSVTLVAERSTSLLRKEVRTYINTSQATAEREMLTEVKMDIFFLLWKHSVALLPVVNAILSFVV